MAPCANCGRELSGDARFCPACGQPVGEPAAEPSEERKLATVLFADLVGSTELGDQDPERTRALLDRFYDAMAAEIEGAGGTVEKFVGDAVMAAFGAPAALEDHAERALHAALSMRRRLEELFGDSLALRIGVNTGDVVVGRPRQGSSFVTGDAVNVAKRLEEHAAPGEILVGERTVAAVRGAFELGEPVTADAKGKPDGIECRRLVRALTLMRPRGVGGLRRAFVGRTSELELLEATYRRVVEQGQPHLVTIVGDAGVGKTRLARELWAWLAEQEPQPLQRTGRCLSYGHAITYWPLGEVLKEQLGILDSDPPASVSRLLEGREILGLTLGLDTAGELHPLTARDRLHEAWVGFLGELVAEQPAVLLVEDLHWAEDELLDLLDRILREVDGPLLLLGTSRPELVDTRAGWGAGRRNTSLLWLEPLEASDSARLVEELLAVDLPAEVRDLVVQRGEGNPFFVEELIAMLIDEGVLERQDSGWSWADGGLRADVEIPDSVQAVVAARIDLLPALEKRALQAAAVVGRVFWVEPVRDLVGGEPDFGLLEERDFVRRRSGSSMVGRQEYAIKHALTREVAYGSVPKARRARLHADLAGWIQRSGAAGDETAALLAHHYAEAVRPQDADLAWSGEAERLASLRVQASEWLERAADLAVGRYEIDEAIALYRQALDLEPGRPEQSRLWHAIGRAHAYKFDGEPFWNAMQQAIELCADDREQADLYSDLAVQTAGRAGMWKRLPEQALVDGWIERALGLSDAESAARAKALVARSMWHRGSDPDDAIRAAVEASAVAERLQDVELRAQARTNRALTAYFVGDYSQALTWSERSFELVDEISDPDLVADVYATAAFIAAAQGRFREARRLGGLHDDVTTRLTDHHRVHGIAILLELEELAGNWPRIRELEERAVELVESNLDTPCIRNPRSLLLCAIAASQTGDEARARVFERRGEELWVEGYGVALEGPRLRLAVTRRDLDTIGEITAAPGSIPPGRRGSTWFHLSATAARLDGLAVVGARADVEVEVTSTPPGTYLEPFALRALGLVREDDELLAQATARFEAMGLDWHAEQTRARLST